MNRHPSYKPSGVKWLGEIPNHWEVKRFKHFGTFSKGKLPKNTNLDGIGFPIIGASEMNGKEPSVFTEDINVPHCLPYEILILWDGANAGLVANNKKGVVASTAVKYTCIDDSINDRYLFYLVKNYQRYYKDKVSGTTIPHMNIAFINDTPLLVPKYAEQTAIANYLDTATAKIDAAIAQQQKMIDLLNERKQIIINRAVTKGLNPNAKMKDSGVEWIGEVPEGWDTCALKKKAKVILGKMLSNNPTNKYKYICAKDVHYGEIDTSDLKEMSFTHEERQLYEVKKGDMLIVEGGAGAGGCAIVKEDLKNIYIQNSIMIVRGAENLLNDYLCFFMQSINQKGYIEYICNKATIPHFTKEKVGAVIIPLPPFKKQVEIVDYLNTAIAPIDDAIKNCNNQISLLQERKQIIINEVVTGKVKVTN